MKKYKCIGGNYHSFKCGEIYSEDDLSVTGESVSYYAKKNAVHWEPVEDFILPVEWHVVVTHDNKDMLSEWKRNSTKFKGNADEYMYVDYDGAGRYTAGSGENITIEQFRKYVLKEGLDMKQTFEVTRDQMRKLYDAACSSWKGQINILMSRHFDDQFAVLGHLPRRIVTSMHEAAVGSQIDVLKEVFPDFKKDRNAFKDGINYTEVDAFSRLCFGSDMVLNLGANTPEDNGLDHLKQKCFVVHPSYEVTTTIAKNGKTIIAISRK